MSLPKDSLKSRALCVSPEFPEFMYTSYALQRTVMKVRPQEYEASYEQWNLLVISLEDQSHLCQIQ